MVEQSTGATRRSVLKTAGGALAGLGLAGAASAAQKTVEVNVGYSAASGKRAAKAEAEGVVREFNFDALTITVAENAIAGLRQRPDVRYVERNGTMHALGQRLTWGVDRTDAEVASANGSTGSGGDVAVIDTGIDSDHPDLVDNLGSGRAFVKARGPYAENWDDDNDHGTHCAGIAGAVDNTEGVRGVATQPTLHAVKVLDKRGSGSYSDIAAGVESVADQGWDVGSMSLGGSSGSQTLKDACSYAQDKGVFLVAAAGNDGPCGDCVSYPAKYAECLAVSSSAQDDTVSDFSSTGPEVELVAPGTDVYSTIPGGYDTFSGTSMATPHVAGAAGILMAEGDTNSQARTQLTDTAEDIGLAEHEQGAGLLDVASALGYDSSDN